MTQHHAASGLRRRVLTAIQLGGGLALATSTVGCGGAPEPAPASQPASQPAAPSGGDPTMAEAAPTQGELMGPDFDPRQHTPWLREGAMSACKPVSPCVQVEASAQCPVTEPPRSRCVHTGEAMKLCCEEGLRVIIGRPFSLDGVDRIASAQRRADWT